jgi:hypothetical protein
MSANGKGALELFSKKLISAKGTIQPGKAWYPILSAARACPELSNQL